MKITSLEDNNNAIIRNILYSLLILLILSLTMLNIIYFKYYKKVQHQNTQTIIANFNLLKSNMSEKLSITASSNIFIDYIRSGYVSRKALLSDFLFQIKMIESPEIAGLKIYNANNKEEIFSYGNKSNMFVDLPLCYFDRELNNKLGQCDNEIKIFFLKDKIIKNLQKINPNIQFCKNCKKLNFFSDKYFGSFPIIKSSQTMLPFKIYQEPIISLTFINIFIVLLMILLASLAWRKTRTVLDRYLSIPMRKIAESVKTGQSKKIKNIITELAYLEDQIYSREERLNNVKLNEKMAAIGQLTSQVAHDIRSPLAAINMIVQKLDDIPEKQRITIRNAAQRINDIANNLLAQYRQPNNIYMDKITKEEFIFILIDRVVSEKREYYANKNIKIDLVNEDANEGIFCKVNASEFSRVISNVIDNAAEAISENGSISVCIKRSKSYLLICIADDGCGMSDETKKKVLEQGVSIGKENGTGIGLSNSIYIIKAFGGDLTIDSILNKGTIINISLPIAEQPNWFLPSIYISSMETIVIVDDDQSIHDIWNTRLSDEITWANLKVLHFYSPEMLIDQYKNLPKNAKFLIDYEFNNSSLTGLDLMNKLSLYKKSILVTSHYEDNDLNVICDKEKVKVIPKTFAIHVPIQIYDKET